MKIKTQNLAGKALDWAVQKVLFARQGDTTLWELDRHAAGNPRGSASTDWSQGGPIIESEELELTCLPNNKLDERWECKQRGDYYDVAYGPTPLVAAMRCFCLVNLGEEVELPEGLKND